jgi:hypothetical protein
VNNRTDFKTNRNKKSLCSVFKQTETNNNTPNIYDREKRKEKEYLIKEKERRKT